MFWIAFPVYGAVPPANLLPPPIPDHCRSFVPLLVADDQYPAFGGVKKVELNFSEVVPETAKSANDDP